ncbi:MAG: hypothetical protein AAFX79_04495 [Planctomycetota bacterium]
MRTRTLLAAALALGLVLATPSTATAQDRPQRLTQMPIVSVDFGGGSLDELVAQIRAASGDTPVNIIYAPEAGTLRVPPVQLEQADVYSALRTIAALSESVPATLPDGREATWEVSNTGGPTPVLLVSMYADDPPAADGEQRTPAGSRHTVVHSLAPLLQQQTGLTDDAVLTAIQIGLEINGETGAELQFHEDTKLLFARVTKNEARAIEQAMNSLDRTAAYNKDDRRAELGGQIMQLLGVTTQEEAIRMRDRALFADRLRDEVAGVRRQLESAQLEAERRVVQHDGEIAEFRGRMSQLVATVSDLERKLARVQDENADLRAALQQAEPPAGAR